MTIVHPTGRRSRAVLAACCLFAALLVGAAYAFAQPAPGGTPDAAREAHATALARAMATGDAATILAAFREHLTTESWGARPETEWRDLAGRLAGDLRGAEVTGIEVDAPGAMTLHLAAPRLPPAVMRLEFEGAEPWRVTTFEFRIGGPEESEGDWPRFELAEGATEQEAFAALDAWLDARAVEDRFSGVVLVARDGRALHTRVAGMASLRHQSPNTIDTRFDLGSINKDFTRVAIGQLLEAGRLRLTDTVASLLPEYPNREVAAKVTVEALLTHTSGLGDMFTPKFNLHSRGRLRALEDYLPLFVDDPLRFEPGTGNFYSNAGFIVLGLIVERLTGMSYQDWVIERIFRPAGMTRAGFFARDGIEPGVADGYTRMYTDEPGAPWRCNVFALPARGNSAGGAQATAADLLAFDNALREHRLLSPPWTRWCFGGPVPEPGAPAGDRARVTAGLGIAGGAPGVTAALESDGRITLIVLGNIDEPMAEAIVKAVRRPLVRALR